MRSFVVEESFISLLKEVNGSDFIEVRYAPSDVADAARFFGMERFFREEAAILSSNYSTINNFSLEHFGVASRGNREEHAVMSMLIRNSRDEILEFYEVRGVLSEEGLTERMVSNVFKTLINTEIAVKTIFIALVDARRRSRNDLVIKYTDIMTQLLKINCYSEFVSRLEG
jgi:hypothetical protein